jgi:hypothetical protein
MTFRHYPFTEAKLKLWTQERRGTGTGADYIPFLQPGDIAMSKEALDRLKCALTGRMAVTFNPIEYRGRSYYELAPGIVDAREHLPLDRDETRAIAKELGVKHPVDRESGVDLVLTTDLVLTLRQASLRDVLLPRDFEPHHVLSSASSFDRIIAFEIARRYWSRRGCQLKIVTDSERCMPKQLMSNIALLRPWRFRPEVEPYPGHFDAVCERIVNELSRYEGDLRLGEWGEDFRARHQMSVGRANEALLHLIYRKRLMADLRAEDLMQQPAKAIATATRERDETRNRSAA